MTRVPRLTVEPDDKAGALMGTLVLKFHDQEVPEELGRFLVIVVGAAYEREAITPHLLARFEAHCYDLMRKLTERRILWQDQFYPWKWRLDEDALRQWAIYMAVRLSALGR